MDFSISNLSYIVGVDCVVAFFGNSDIQSASQWFEKCH